MIRTLFSVIFLIIYLVGTLPVLLYLKILERFNPKHSHLISFRMVQAAFKILIFISGSKVTYLGLDNIPKDRSALYIGNHKGYFDIVCSYTVLASPTGFLAKKELKYVPLLGWWITRISCVYVDRSNVKEGLKSILTAVEQMKQGINMFIFPEGTRSENDEILPFHGGSFKVAIKSGAPVVPVAIRGTENILETQFPWVKPSKVIIEFGEPIETEGMTPDEKKHLASATEELVRDMYRSLCENHRLS